MAAIFQDGRHGLYWTTTLCLKLAADSQKWFWEWMICTELKECEFDFMKNQNVQLFAIWLPFNNMAAIDNDK